MRKLSDMDPGARTYTGLDAVLPAGTLHVTASTGIAAIAVNGCTIHSFAGIGLGNGPHDRIVQKCTENPATRARWQQAECLIIDEVSMISADTFELLSSVAKACRANGSPFGGLQLITCGDFFQLGPVKPWRAGGKEFAFEADAWAATVQNHVCLHKVVRQQGDASFVRVLEEVRWGCCSTQTHEGIYLSARLFTARLALPSSPHPSFH